MSSLRALGCSSGLPFPAVSQAQCQTLAESFNLFPSTHLGAEGLVVGDCAVSSHTAEFLLPQEKGRMLGWSRAPEWAD